jgi:hypothetical protein
MVAELFVANSKQTKSPDYYLAMRNLFFLLSPTNTYFLSSAKFANNTLSTAFRKFCRVSLQEKDILT